MDAFSAAFLEEFESKLERFDECCVPGAGSTGLPRCLASHVMGPADPVAGSLFACYWGARTGALSARDLRGPMRALREYESVPCEGLTRADPESCHGSCCLNNLGLEFYSGSVCGSSVHHGGGMVSVDSLLRSKNGWSFVRDSPVEVFWKNPDSPDHATVDYAYIEASVGNFTEFVAERIEKIPVVCRVCRYASEKDCWLEYVDRTGRLYRFDVTDRVLGASHNCMGTTVIRDALYKGYRRDAASVRFIMKESDEYRSSVVSYARACEAAKRNERHQLVVAVMPAMSDTDMITVANNALVRACSLHLSDGNAPVRKRAADADADTDPGMERLYKQMKNAQRAGAGGDEEMADVTPAALPS